MKKKFYGILIIAVVILVALLYFLYSYLHPYYQVEDRQEEIMTLQNKVDDKILGWIRVQGTNIDYPIIDGSKSNVGQINYDYTWMLYDTEKIENRMAVFGHNIQNVSSYPLIGEKNHRRFEQLMGFLYTSFNEENQYIQLTIGEHDYLYQVYAVYFDEEEDFGNNLLQEDMEDYIEKAKMKSYFDFQVDVKKKDKLLTLITCTRFFGAMSDYQFKVEGRLVREGETVIKHKVVEMTAYKEIKKIWKEGERDEEV